MKHGQQRARTDESLRHERAKTDAELDRRRVEVESRADDSLARSRARADAEVRNTRERADDREPGPLPAEVAQERRREDEVLRREREAADEKLLAERREGRRALAELLRFERESTDEQLGLERVRADEEIASRDQFLGVVSHDLRNLLGGMALSAAWLARFPDGGEVEEVRREARRVQRYVARMNRLAGDLLDVVSIEAGRLRVNAERRAVGDPVHDAVDAFEPLATSRGISLAARVHEPTLEAEFDHERIVQVLANLVSNAIRFTPDGGEVAIDVERVGAEVRFRVSDTGPGVAPEHAAAVFERFARGAPGAQRGYGLGLFISRWIVEAHGGRIGVEQGPGGACFWFTLPLPSGDPPGRP